MEQAEIVLFKNEENIQFNVVVENDTVWLTQEQISELFGTKRPAITKHIKNIYKSGELNDVSTCSILEHMGKNGTQKYKTKYYNLDIILSVGYRVNSKNATQFRIWANQILKDYLLKGYAVHQRIERLEDDIHYLKNKAGEFDLHLKNTLPKHQGIFFNGDVYDAYDFVIKIIKSAKCSIHLIDNYIDTSVITMLSNKNIEVKVNIYTNNISKQLQLDVEKFNRQYGLIKLQKLTVSHDRFLIIDEKEIYHIGASLKDLGKKWFAFSKLNIGIDNILSKLNVCF
jgi:hypothetical protein